MKALPVFFALVLTASLLSAAEIHRWTFDGNANDTVGGIELALTNGASIANGRLVLDGTDDFAVTPAALPAALGERTFVAWVSPANLTQQGGGVLTVARTSDGVDTFDGIVFGERVDAQWINGSNGFTRTVTDNGGPAETVTPPGEVMIAVVYGPGNEITIYRDGELYSTAGASKGSLVTYSAGESFIRLGQRHPNGSPATIYFAGQVNEARVYDQPLTSGEIDNLHNAGPTPDVAPPPSVASPNLTAGALATQSSTFPTTLPDRTDAGVAIDSDLSPTNRTATAADDIDPWLEIELQRDAFIERVELLNLNNPLDAGCCRSRLRDITIEVLDQSGAVLAASPLLNAENAGFTFPNGPLSLAHRFELDVPARTVRVRRTSDPDLSGTGGQGDPDQEANTLALREVVVNGQFVTTPPVTPFAATFDSRRAAPDPVSQLWYDTETIVGSDGVPADGFINAGANVGLVADGAMTAWQTNDQLTDGSFDNPWYRNLLDRDELRALHDLGWTYSFTVRAVSDTSTGGDSGFSGWGFSAANNPGWDIGANADARVGFAIGRNPDNTFYVRPQNQNAVTLPAGSGSDYHTITCVGQPRRSVYVWFIDGVSQGMIDFATVDVGGLTSTNLSFGSGSSSGGRRTANWKQVSLTTVDSPSEPALSGLRFYLPFEPGPAGNEFLAEQSHPPGAKPAIAPLSGNVTSVAPGAQGEAATFSGAPFLDATAALPDVADLGSATLSAWIRTDAESGTILAISNADSTADAFTSLAIAPSADPQAPQLSFATAVPDGAGGSDLRTLASEAAGLRDGAWHHVALTVTPTEARLFYDGVQIRSAGPGFAPLFTSALAGLDSFTIGALRTAAQPAGGAIFAGDLDEVAIWDRALDRSEIANLFSLGYHGVPLALDRDGDSLNIAEEAALGTSDNSTDSDSDTLRDDEELVLRTDPANADTDGDTIADNLEVAGGTDPRRSDSDGDGFRDDAELAAGTDPLDPKSFPDTTSPDSDGDGLTDAEEALAGTNPDEADTDGDSVSDSVEILLGSDPLDGASTPALSDFDDDGLTDGQEASLGTNPNAADSDGDGFSDHAEVNGGSNPNDNSSVPAAAVIVETGISRAPDGEITFRFDVLGSATNLRLQSSPDIQSGFTDLAAAVTPGPGNSYTAVATPPASHRFFRAAGDTAAGEVTSASANLTLPLDTNGMAITVLPGTEGVPLAQQVFFTAPFTGYVSYTLSGLAPNGKPLPATTGAIAVSNASSVQIPLTLFDDLAVAPQARYVLTLTNNGGVTAGIDSTVTFVIEDNDAVWSGTLGAAGEQLNFVLESLTNGTETVQRLTATNSSSLFPQGTFPATATFGETTFSVTAGTIPLTRSGGLVTARPGTITSLELSANSATDGHQVTPTRIRGALSLTLAPANGTASTTSGRFSITKRPPPSPAPDLNLTPVTP